MVRLAWRMLCQRPASVIATFVALSIAVAVVTACGVMLESGVRFHGALKRYAAAPVLVATTDIRVTDGSGDDRDVESNPLAERGRVDATLTSRIAAAPGVRAAIGDTAVAGQLVEGRSAAEVQAHPWSAASLSPFTLRAGTAPRNADQVVLDQRLAARAGIRPGQSVRFEFAAGPRTFTVSGLAAPTGAAPDGATVFLDGAEARALSGDPGHVDVIGVLPDRGVSDATLAAAVRHVLPAEPGSPDGAYPRVFSGADRGDAESVDVASGRGFVIALSGASGGVTLMIAILVIAGSVGLSVQQRHRDIALLRAIAATPRQVRRMIVRETLAVGVVAAGAGIAPGLYAAGWLRDQFVAHGLAPHSFTKHVSWLPPLVAAAAALLVAVVAGWIAALRASRIRPAEALADSTVERTGLGVVRAVLGLLGLGGGITLAIVAGDGSGDVAESVMVPAVFLFVIAIAAWSPLVLRAATATVGRLVTGLGVTGRLATANTAAASKRLSVVVSSAVLAVALGGSMWFLPSSERHAAQQQGRAGLTAGYVVEPAAPGLPPGVTAKLRGIDGVTAAAGAVRSTMFSPQGGFSDLTALGVDAAAGPHTLDLGVTHGRLADLHGDTIALDSLTADSLGLQVGGRFHGWFGDGVPADLRVVAIYTRGLGFAHVTVSRDVLLPHTTARLDDLVLIATDKPAAVRARLARLAPGATLEDRTAYRTELDSSLDQNDWANQLLAIVLIGYAVIAAVNTLVMTGLARRREFAILRLTGTTRLQIRRMVCLEQVLLIGLALVLGVAIAAVTLVPTVQSLTGSARPYIPPGGWLTLGGGTVALGAVALVPVRRALRPSSIEAVGSRE